MGMFHNDDREAKIMLHRFKRLIAFNGNKGRTKEVSVKNYMMLYLW